ncbi:MULTISPECIES: YdcH family protein [unclassified Vibrio]|uniref:YdcH family protein n=1 Tax=Vibrio sp. HB236076 TaxID=3232307 RepID=A0AB39HL46_9VIBR|nr:YdcH family protein [Vibrio sp. HB161653]MDP5252714.1 YdcH family protein [Vibrio sp. HB161653]
MQTLNQSDQTFAQKAKEYHQIDEEIRKLELKDSPIIDEAMQRLKHHRTVLKDWLYRQLISA